MEEAAFREFLETRHLEPEAVERSVAIVRRFEEFLRRFRPAADASRATAGDVRRFVDELARTAEDTEGNILAVARYWRVTHDDEAVIAALEMIDGAQVPENLSRKLAELVGEERRDEVFAGLEDSADRGRPCREERVHARSGRTAVPHDRPRNGNDRSHEQPPLRSKGGLRRGARNATWRRRISTRSSPTSTGATSNSWRVSRPTERSTSPSRSPTPCSPTSVTRPRAAEVCAIAARSTSRRSHTRRTRT